MTAVLDTNIIIYAVEGNDTVKGAVARRLLDVGLDAGWVVPRQVIGELLAVGHRRGGALLANARMIAALLEAAADVVDTDKEATNAATTLAERRNLQYFDALICSIAERSGAAFLFTEDMHDSLAIGAMTLIDPFNPSNRERVDALIDG